MRDPAKPRHDIQIFALSSRLGAARFTGARDTGVAGCRYARLDAVQSLWGPRGRFVSAFVVWRYEIHMQPLGAVGLDMATSDSMRLIRAIVRISVHTAVMARP